MKRIYFHLATLLTLSVAIASCSNLDESAYVQTDKSDIILSETFASSFGKFSTYNVLGDQIWTINSKEYAGMSGYIIATKQNVANEDWLISPEIDLSNIQSSYLSFDYVLYKGNPSTDATVWVSENYANDSLPSAATWTKLNFTVIPDGGSYNFLNSEQISLTKYTGKKIHIAFKYLSTSSSAGTFEIRNFLIKTGEAVITNNGNGTNDFPYTVTGALQNQTAANAWVKGYIVGYAWYANSQNNFYLSADTCTQATNLLIADSLSNIYLSKCVAVQLPAGAVRNGLNLKDLKANYGKEVTLYGSLTSYFGMAGLKNTSYYVLQDGTTGGNKPFDPTNAIYYETFASGMGAFTQYSVTGNQLWTWDSKYKCAIMNGYASGSRYVNEDWLISPTINLPATLKSATLNFSMAGKYFYGSITKNCKLYVSSDYSTGNPTAATWTPVTIPNYDTSDNFTFTNSGDISMNDYIGKPNVRIAIVYTSDGTSTGTGQLEINNFIVY